MSNQWDKQKSSQIQEQGELQSGVLVIDYQTNISYSQSKKSGAADDIYVIVILFAENRVTKNNCHY